MKNAKLDTKVISYKEFLKLKIDYIEIPVSKGNRFMSSNPNQILETKIGDEPKQYYRFVDEIV